MENPHRGEFVYTLSDGEHRAVLNMGRIAKFDTLCGSENAGLPLLKPYQECLLRTNFLNVKQVLNLVHFLLRDLGERDPETRKPYTPDAVADLMDGVDFFELTTELQCGIEKATVPPQAEVEEAEETRRDSRFSGGEESKKKGKGGSTRTSSGDGAAGSRSSK